MTAIAWMGVVVTTLGAALATFGIAVALQERRRERSGRQVPGTIVDLVEGSSAGFPRLRAAVFEFAGDDGRRVRRQSSVFKGKPTHVVGDAVTVWHDPADPDRSGIVGESSGIAPIAAGLGLVFTAVGIALVWAGR